MTLLDGTKILKNNTFQNCTSLTEVTIPDSVTNIQGSVFRGCTALEEITLPEGITSLGTYIFEGCTALSEVNFGAQSTITKLGNYMFQNCTALKSISLPSTLTYLGTYTFQNSGLTSIDLSGLTGLTRLGTSATACNTSAKSYVFADCKDLTAVTLPSGLTRIGGYAFYGCENLASVNLSNLVQINAFAFAGTAISEVSLSAATEFIGGGAFAGCAALESISIPVTNTAYRTDDGVLYTADGTIVCYPAGKVTADGTVTLEAGQNIGDGAFAGNANVTKVIIPEGMTEIGEYAFYDSSVKEIVLPESLTSIGTYAFAFSDIESITIPASLEFIGDYAFAFSALKEATIEATALVKSSSTSSITGITTYTYAQYLFQNCEQLAAVHLPEGLEIIVTGMFQNCYSLEAITLPESVTTIMLYAFDGSGLKSFTFNDNIEIVGNYAFQNSALEEVTINIEAFISAISTSNGAITYASYIFQNCTNLATVNFGAESGFNYIGQYMFAGCTALKSITIPDTVTTIQKGAFSGSGLVSIVIPESIVDPGVTSSGIYASAFANCTSLESAVLPSSTKLIEDSLFAGCTALKSITVPRTISVISTGAFAGCTALKDLYIPIEVYDLSTSNTALFEGWTSEQTVHFEATKAQIYLNWDIGWDMNTDATFVFGETQGETSEN